jgi:molecular chaperone GrpE
LFFHRKLIIFSKKECFQVNVQTTSGVAGGERGKSKFEILPLWVYIIYLNGNFIRSLYIPMQDDKEKNNPNFQPADEESCASEECREEKAAENEKVTAEAAEENKEEKKEEKKLTPEEEMALLKEKYIYLQAEYQNYRKRMVKELADARRFAIEDTVQPFFAVYDFLSMAETAAAQSDNIEAIRQGLMMIIAQYRKAFEDLNLKPFDAKGEKFDPALHDAVAHECSEEIEEGVVSKQWNCGFKLGDKVLRPARVVVSSGAPKEKTEEESAKKEE